MEDSLTGKDEQKESTVTGIFREAFPMYLAIGMTYEQFWEGESWLVKAFRKAKHMKRDEDNYYAWLHGVYVLNALQSGVPVILNGIAKERIDLPTFPEKPIDFKEVDKEKQEAKQMELQKAKMKEMVEQFNAAFKRKHADK